MQDITLSTQEEPRNMITPKPRKLNSWEQISIDATPELNGLAPTCRVSLHRRMGITTKDQVIKGLANKDISINNGKIWGKHRHNLLLNWLGITSITETTTTTKEARIQFSNGTSHNVKISENISEKNI
jgi:hypothetical protein